MLNQIVISGRLTRDPELRYTQSGTPVASFTVAVDRDYGRDRERETDFIDCVAWRQGGEFVHNYFGRGDMICVTGRLQSRKWQDRDGNNRTSWEINVEHSYFCGSKRDSDSGSRTAPLSPACGGYFPLKGEAREDSSTSYNKTAAQRSGCGFERKNEGADMEFSAYAGNGMERAYSDDGDNPFVNRQRAYEQEAARQTDLFDGELPF